LPDRQLGDAARVPGSIVPISTVLHLTSEGLVLGAGTLLVAADVARGLSSLRGQEARVLALLSAAYNRAVPPSVLGNIERAAKSWREGDDSLAYIHLAHAGLPELQEPRNAARRLFLADELMKAGGKPRTIFEILDLDAAFIDALEKRYNPAEPRLPAGSGRISGEWTRLLSWLGNLTAAQAAELDVFAARFSAWAAVFGLLFVPSINNLGVEGEVPGLPGLRYGWNRDETLLHFTYDSPDGRRRAFTAQLEDDLFRDPHGRVVGRVLPGGSIAIDRAAVSPDLLDENEPRLCPEPGPDKAGGSEMGRKYEDYVKKFVNPEPRTPSGYGVQLANPAENGALVFYDDCQRSTGMMVEAKGGYAGVLKFPEGRKSITKDWSNQSGRQVAARGWRRLCWYFAEPATAAFAEDLFRTTDQGRETIDIKVLPWPEKGNE
jgi:hypothetical protein